MSAFDQTATCAWCLLEITRAGRNRAPWSAGTRAQCSNRNDGKYYHEPLEPGESPHAVCLCKPAYDVATGTFSIAEIVDRCTLHGS